MLVRRANLPGVLHGYEPVDVFVYTLFQGSQSHRSKRIYGKSNMMASALSISLEGMLQLCRHSSVLKQTEPNRIWPETAWPVVPHPVSRQAPAAWFQGIITRDILKHVRRGGYLSLLFGFFVWFLTHSTNVSAWKSVQTYVALFWCKMLPSTLITQSNRIMVLEQHQ